MKIDPLNEYEFKIAGGEKKVLPVIEGTFFYLLNLSHSRVAVKVNGGKLRTGGRAKGHNYESVDGFKIERVEVFNLDATLELTGILQVGEGTPLDNIFQIDSDEVTPTLRDEIPVLIEELVSEADTDGLGAWVLLAPADDFRAELELHTNAATAAHWAPDDTFDLCEGRNIVTAGGLQGIVKIRNKSAIYVWHTEAGTEIRATVHKFA